MTRDKAQTLCEFQFGKFQITLLKGVGSLEKKALR